MVNLPAKKDVTLALLERSTVYIHLDPRREGVAVPPWFKNQPQLVLQVGLNMNIPIPDLEVDESGVRCTLSFNRSPHFCSIPWPAVYALVGDDGRGMVWPDDVPEEVVAQAQAESPKQRDHLRAVPSTESGDDAKKAARPASPSKRRENVATASDGSKRQRSRAKTTRAKADVTDAASQSRGKKRVREKARASEQAQSPSRKPVRMRVEAAPNAEASKSAVPTAESAASRRRELPPYLRIVK